MSISKSPSERLFKPRSAEAHPRGPLFKINDVNVHHGPHKPYIFDVIKSLLFFAKSVPELTMT